MEHQRALGRLPAQQSREAAEPGVRRLAPDQHRPLQAFREQREDADPDADLKIWQLDGALLLTPAVVANQSNYHPLRSMAHAGRLALLG